MKCFSGLSDKLHSIPKEAIQVLPKEVTLPAPPNGLVIPDIPLDQVSNRWKGGGGGILNESIDKETHNEQITVELIKNEKEEQANKEEPTEKESDEEILTDNILGNIPGNSRKPPSDPDFPSTEDSPDVKEILSNQENSSNDDDDEFGNFEEMQQHKVPPLTLDEDHVVEEKNKENSVIVEDCDEFGDFASNQEGNTTPTNENSGLSFASAAGWASLDSSPRGKLDQILIGVSK